MRKILISVMIISLVCALLGAGVYASFSDTETSSNNQFVAGTLDLTVDAENPWSTTKIDVSGMKPGDSGVATCTLYNDGSVDASSLLVDITNLSDSEGANPEPEGDTTEPGDLSANMDMVIWVDTDNDGVQDAGETVLASGKLNALSWTTHDAGSLDAGNTKYVSLTYAIASSVGNDIQGDSTTFDIEFVLNQ